MLWCDNPYIKAGFTLKQFQLVTLFMTTNFWKYIRRKHKNVKFDSLSELKMLCRRIELIKTSRKDWQMIENEELIEKLIRHWAVSSSPVVIMGPPGVGKSLGKLFSFLNYKWLISDLIPSCPVTDGSKLVRDFHKIFSSYWQIFENSSRNFPKISGKPMFLIRIRF